MARGKPEERPSRIHRETPQYRREARALGIRVRFLRQQQDLTLEQAAERMDLDLKHLQKIESGTINVTLVTLVRLARGLGAPLGSLFVPCPDKSIGRAGSRSPG
jgi:transcriptional regulator with XRE-family HTH domain